MLIPAYKNQNYRNLINFLRSRWANVYLHVTFLCSRKKCIQSRRKFSKIQISRIHHYCSARHRKIILLWSRDDQGRKGRTEIPLLRHDVGQHIKQILRSTKNMPAHAEMRYSHLRRLISQTFETQPLWQWQILSFYEIGGRVSFFWMTDAMLPFLEMNQARDYLQFFFRTYVFCMFFVTFCILLESQKYFVDNFYTLLVVRFSRP